MPGKHDLSGTTQNVSKAKTSSEDNDCNFLMQELWCKKLGPSQELIASYAMQRTAIEDPIPMPTRQTARELAPLLTAADLVGSLLQNDYQGFLPNRCARASL